MIDEDDIDAIKTVFLGVFSFKRELLDILIYRADWYLAQLLVFSLSHVLYGKRHVSISRHCVKPRRSSSSETDMLRKARIHLHSRYVSGMYIAYGNVYSPPPLLQKGVTEAFVKACLGFTHSLSIFKFYMYTSSAKAFLHFAHTYGSVYILTRSWTPAISIYAWNAWLFSE